MLRKIMRVRLTVKAILRSRSIPVIDYKKETLF